MSLKRKLPIFMRNALPKGYTRCGGLIGDGNAYLDLDTELTQDSEVEIQMSFSTDITQRQVFGGRESASANNINIAYASTANRIVLDFNNSDYTDYRLLQTLNKNTRYTLLMNKNKRAIYQGSTLVAENATVCPDTISLSDVYLFFASGTPSSNTKFIGTIYSCKIKGARNLVPAKRTTDNAFGMYDLIEHRFFENVGTGSFTGL